MIFLKKKGAGLPVRDEEDYTVEAIVDERKVGTRKEYLVKWDGYPAESNTWEPKENLDNCKAIVDEWRKSDQYKQRQQEYQAAKKAPAKRASVIPVKRKSTSLGLTSRPRASSKVPDKPREAAPRARKRFKKSFSPSLMTVVLESLPSPGATSASSNSNSQVQKSGKTSRCSTSPFPTSVGKKKPSAKRSRTPSTPPPAEKLPETKSQETQTPDDPMTRIIPKDLLPLESEIERLRRRAEFAVSVKGRILPSKLPENFDPDDALVMVTFYEDGVEEAAIFLHRVVKFVIPLLLVKFYKRYTDIQLSTDADLESFR